MTQHIIEPIVQSGPRPASHTGVRGLVQRHPLAWFFVLSCALSWWPAVLYAVHLSPQPIAGFGPFLAAITVLGLTQGRDGIRQLLRRMVQWRVPPRAYLFAIGTPLLVSGTAIVANAGLGATVDSAKVGLWTQIPLSLGLILLIPGLGGAWEEPGFRGFALARLESRFGRITAPLLLGAFWVAWHLPLFVTGQILLPDVLVVLAASVVIAAVLHAGRESVLIAMLLHATNNAVGGSYASQLFHGADAVRLGLLTAAGWWMIAALILIRQRSIGFDQ